MWEVLYNVQGLTKGATENVRIGIKDNGITKEAFLIVFRVSITFLFFYF